MAKEGGEEKAIEKLLEAARAGTLYGASLPERTLRAIVGAAGGVLRESAQAAVPDAMKGGKLYEITVRKMLRFVIEDVGGLEGAASPASCDPGLAPAAPPAGTEYVVKKAIGNVIDVAGIATLHMSPLWVIALFSDVVHGARTYVNALADELRRTGVLTGDARFENVDGLLGALQRVSGTVADHLDTPPVTLGELQKMVTSLREESSRVDLTTLIPEEQLAAVWNGIQEEAAAAGRSPFEISSALAMKAYGQLERVGKGAFGGVKVGFDLLNDNVIRYYLDSLGELHEKGFYQTVMEASGPYLHGMRHLFEAERETYTEKVLKGKPLRALWAKAKAWCRARRLRRRRGGEGSGDRA
jgi:hypothetical protein